MIRAIFFDLDGTLIDRAGLWGRCLGRFLASHGHELRDGDEVADVLRSPFASVLRVAHVLQTSVPSLGMELPAIARALRREMRRAAEPDTEVNGLLDDLAPRYTTAIATNGSGHLQLAKIAGADLAGRTGAVFVSGRMGVAKPAPAFFGRVLAWAKVAPGEALIVGDHPHEDILGGQRVGLLTCAVGTRYLDRWPRPDFRIDRITDLPRVLG